MEEIKRRGGEDEEVVEKEAAKDIVTEEDNMARSSDLGSTSSFYSSQWAKAISAQLEEDAVKA